MGPALETLTRPELMGWRRRRALAIKHAQARDALPTPAEWRAAGREDLPGQCMTGDGEPIERGRLCARCLARPYGALGDRLPDTDCRVCFEDREKWYGNLWSPVRLCSWPCEHDHAHHDGEGPPMA